MCREKKFPLTEKTYMKREKEIPIFPVSPSPLSSFTKEGGLIKEMTPVMKLNFVNFLGLVIKIITSVKKKKKLMLYPPAYLV